MDDDKFVLVRKTMRLTPEVDKMLQQFAWENHMSQSSAANEILKMFLIKQSTESSSEPSPESVENTDKMVDQVVSQVMERFSKRYDNILQKTYNKSRFIDENVSVVKEILNCMCNYTAYGPVPDYDCEVVQSAKEKVKKNIAGAKERVDNQR